MSENDLQEYIDARKKVKLSRSSVYFRTKKNHSIGEKLDYAPNMRAGGSLKSSITKDEKWDERTRSYWEKQPGYDPEKKNWGYCTNEEFTYEVELVVVRKYNSRTLTEITDQDKVAEPILPEDKTESWDGLAG